MSKSSSQKDGKGTLHLSAQLPLTELLNSQFCIGTALTQVNREAVEHTKILAKSATTISRFWRKYHTCSDMFYDGRPATWAGPLHSEIGSDDSVYDVLIVQIALSVSHDNPSRRILRDEGAGKTKRNVEDILEYCTRRIASNITQWYQESLSRRYFCSSVMLPEAAYLHFHDRFFRYNHEDDENEKYLIKISAAKNSAPCRMMIRAGVLRDYLQHHSLWAALYSEKDCPIASSKYLTAWMATTLNILTYGNQVGSVDLRIHRSAAAFLSYAFPDSRKIEWDQVNPELKDFLLQKPS